VDLSQLTFMDSSGLGLIHESRTKAIDDGGNLVVCNPVPTVLRVMEITGLDTWVVDWDPAWSKGARVACATQSAASASRSDSPG
jgi:anti-anti-sigma factor